MEKKHEIRFDEKEMFFELITNYKLTRNMIETIENFEGIDKLDVEGSGNYSIYYTIGKMFQDSTVNAELSKMLKQTYEIAD